MRRSVLQAAGMYDAEKTVEEQFENIQVRIANIEEGRFATEEELNSLKAAGFDPANFDQRKASKNPQFSRALKGAEDTASIRSEEHTSELQSRPHLVCRLLLEKKKKKQK